MSFITSKDTIDALMGPALRKQSASDIQSPRQQRLRAFSARSSSAPSLLLSRSMTEALSHLPDDTDGVPSGVQNSASSSERQHALDSSAKTHPSALHSQAKRRRSRHPLYGCVDIGGRSNLAPVIELASSPTEDLPDNSSSSSSMPRDGHYKGRSGLLQFPASRSSPNLTATSHEHDARSAPVLPRERAYRTSAMYTTKTADSSHGSSSNSDESIAVVRSPSLVENSRIVSQASVLLVHSDSVDAAMLEHELEQLSLEMPFGIHTSMSSPELTCSSFASSEDSNSRSSLSSSSSDADPEESRLSNNNHLTAKDILEYNSRKLSKAYAKFLPSTLKKRSSSSSLGKASSVLGLDDPASVTAVMPTSTSTLSDKAESSSASVVMENQPKTLAGLFKSSTFKSSWSRKTKQQV